MKVRARRDSAHATIPVRKPGWGVLGLRLRAVMAFVSGLLPVFFSAILASFGFV
jgi:hypothetical protein